MAKKQTIPDEMASNNLAYYRRNKELVNQKKKKDRLYRKSIGMCGTCSNDSLPGKVLCQSCKDRNNESMRNISAARKAAGGCAKCCSEEPISGITICYGCWIRKKSSDHLGTELRWMELDKKLSEQNWTCPYTGLELKPGLNASIDHIFPSSTHPDLELDIDNLEWVDVRFNRTKFDYTPDQFFHMSIAVLVRRFADKLGPGLCYALKGKFPQEDVLNLPMAV